MRHIGSTGAPGETQLPLEQKLGTLLRKRRFLVVVALLSLYLVLTCWLAVEKVIWTDEFFTLYLSRLPRFADVSAALMTGGDQHPLPFYITHGVFIHMFGESALVLRLPEIVAFLLMSVCVYCFVTKRTSPVYGVLAMAAPMVTAAYDYAFEARGYGLVLGFFALAVLCWQQLGDRGWRTLSLIGLAAGLAAALGSHFYAVLLFPAIAVAEVARSLRRNEWDPLVWLAMCGPAVTIAICFPYLRAASGFAHTFWAKPEWAEIHVFYMHVLGPAITSIGAGLALAGIYALLSRAFQRLAVSQIPFPHIEEVVLAAALAVAPAIGVVVGKTLTSAFAWRYAIGAVIGLSILFALCCFTLFRGSAVAASVLILALAAWFTAFQVKRVELFRAERSNLQDLIRLIETGSGSAPIVIGTSDLFYKISYYSPPEHRDRYIFLADTERSRKYLGHDTVDRSLLALNPWFRLHVEPYAEFIAREHRFTLVSDLIPGWDWMPSALLDDNRQLRVTRRAAATLEGTNRAAEGHMRFLFDVSTP